MIKKYILIILCTLFILSCFDKSGETDEEIIDIQISEANSVVEEIPIIEEIIEEKISITYDFNIINDDVEFIKLPDIGVISGKYAVVGSENVLLYPNIDLTSNEDLNNLTSEIIIPIGTIIPIEGIIEIKDSIHENYFTFEGDKNFFYKTTVNNQSGIVWGADLVLNLKDEASIKKTSYYYSSDFKDRGFLPFNGEYNLSNNIKSDIKTDRIGIEKTNSNMLSLYQKDSQVLDNTIYITTDLITNTLNTLYKGLKSSIEINQLHSDLLIFVDDIIIQLEQYKNDDNNKNIKYSEALDSTYNYFLLSKVLLNYTDDGEKVNDLLSKMPKEVIDEYTIITTESGTSKSPIMNLDQDYSSFSPTGYYADIDELKSYYMTIKWFSEMELQSRMVLIITQMFRESDQLMEKWSKISKLLQYISGSTLKFSLEDLLLILDEKDIYNLSYWMESDENVSTLLDDSLIFKFFAQNSDKSPLLNNFNWNTGLDFISALGSRSATYLLEQRDSINKQQNSMMAISDDTYNKYFMDLLQSVAEFEQNKNFYFMEKGSWNKKMLNATHASWIEFSSDIKLDENREYIEIGREGDELVTFRTKAYPEPKHFVEPNIEYFNKLIILLDSWEEFIDFELLDNRYTEKISKFRKIAQELKDIVDLEINNMDISKDQNSYIRSIPGKLNSITGSLGLINPIVDIIYTNADDNTILEAGVGYPYRIFIALDDEYGGKRVATGYTYSYFEFIQDSDDSLTNKTWKDRLENNNTLEYLPFWAHN